MKNLLLSAIVVTAFLFNNETKAQVRFNVNINVGSRPGWGLPGNTRGDYYYLPEIDCYYDIPNRQFIYFNGRDWLFALELPYMYHGYDLYRGFKVIVNEPKPYLRGNYYRKRYHSYYNAYRSPVFFPQRDTYRNYNNGRFNGGGNDWYDRRKEYERNDHDRDDDHHHDNDRGRHHRGRG